MQIPKVLLNKKVIISIVVIALILGASAYVYVSKKRKTAERDSLVEIVMNDIDAGVGERGRDDFRTTLLNVRPDSKYNPKVDAEALKATNTYLIKYKDKAKAILRRLSRNQIKALDIYYKKTYGQDLQDFLYDLCRTDLTGDLWKKFSWLYGFGTFVEATGLDTKLFAEFKTIVANSIKK